MRHMPFNFVIGRARAHTPGHSGELDAVCQVRRAARDDTSDPEIEEHLREQRAANAANVVVWNVHASGPILSLREPVTHEPSVGHYAAIGRLEVAVEKAVAGESLVVEVAHCLGELQPTT